MRDLSSPKVLKEILSEYEFRFSKSLGQNFLIDSNVLNDIILGANLSKDDYVLEIGSGFGTLTQRMLGVVKKVVCVEIDKTVIPVLKENIAEFDNFEIVNEDILKIDLESFVKEKFMGNKVKVVANLPYYITTPIIMMLLESNIKFESITVMVQKEVAQRLCAKEGTKDFGAITLSVNYYSNPNILFCVPPSSFMPAPKVTSAVIRMDILENPSVDVLDKETFFKTIKAAFLQRRKTLVNALCNSGYFGVTKDDVLTFLKELNLNEKCRGETLSIQKFALLSDKIYKKSLNK